MRETTDEELPREVIAAEVAAIERLGVVVALAGEDSAEVRFDRPAATASTPCLLACGTAAGEAGGGWGLPVAQRGIRGDAADVRNGDVRRVCRRRRGSRQDDGGPQRGRRKGGSRRHRPVLVRLEADRPGRAAKREDRTDARRGVAAICSRQPHQPRRPPAFGLQRDSGFTCEEGVEQAARCLHCDCRGATSCKLRKYAAQYGASTRRFKAERRVFQQDARHAEVIYEPGKCIDCGLCIQIAAAAGEPLGLTFVGRGFDVRVAVPLDRSLAEALSKAAAECVAACPTAALAWKTA